MSASPILLGAVIGFAGCMGIAFAVIAFLDSRFVTRLEYAATLKRIDDELKRIGDVVAPER